MYPLRLFGDPVLKQRAREVEELNDDLVTLVNGMYDTMDLEDGIGLAAPQVGVRKRLFTFDLHEGDGPGVVINPEIVESDGEVVSDEGCLSVPGYRFEVVRAERVTMRGIDLDGNEIVLEGDDLLARMIQHEIDHLDGVLLLDRVEPDVRREALKEMRTHDFPMRQVPARGVPAATAASRPAPACASSSSAPLTTRCPPLHALHAAGHDIALVVTQPDRRRGRGSEPTREPGEGRRAGARPARAHAGTLAARCSTTSPSPAPTLGVVVAFGQLLPEALLDAVPHGFVNVHFSLLPRWRGAAPVERAMLANDPETGVCIMALEKGLDTGPVYARAVVPDRGPRDRR